MNTPRPFSPITAIGFASLLLVTLSACGEKSPPPASPPLAGDGGTGGSGGASGSPDAGDAGDVDAGDGGTMTGDLCTDHLSGISCQVEEIASDSYGFCARFSSGDVKCWGNAPFTTSEVLADEPDETGDALRFADISGRAARLYGDDTICALLEGNRVDCGSTASEHTFDPSRPVTSIGVGGPSDDVWFLFGDAQVTRMDRFGSLEVVDLPFTPVALSSQVSEGQGDLGTTCALTTVGEVRCWGMTDRGAFGVGDNDPRTIDSSEPVDLGEAVSSMVVDQDNVCAITASGALKCWGRGYEGLGQGQTLTTGFEDIGDEPGEIEGLAPVPFPAGRVVQVAIGGDQGSRFLVCAVLDDGSLSCWGENGHGQCGQGYAQAGGTNGGLARPSPAIDLGTGRHALQVAATVDAVCALLDDHSVKCRGSAADGLLGDGRAEPAENVGDEPGEMGDALPRVDFGTMTRAEAEGFPPTVSVISPAPSTGVESASEADALEVTCSVVANADTGDDVDGDSVRVQLISSVLPDVPVLDVPAVAGEGTTYTATLRGLRAFPSGAYQVRCVASDTAVEPRTGRGSVVFLQDSGPNLQIVSPTVDGAVVGLTSLLHVAVSVFPGVLGDPDPGADIASMEVVLAGVELTLTAGSIAGSYAADVDLLSSVFEPPPSGPILLRVTATNARGNQRTVTREVVVDDEGPVITATGMVSEGTLVRGARTLQLNVTDDLSGTDPSSVRGYVANNPTPIVFTQVGTSFQGMIDTQVYGSTATQLPLRIVASDRVGNMSDLALTLRLDNAPPILSLDPPDIRETKSAAGTLQCSAPFDPVGDDSVNDRQMAPEGAEFRARIEDQNPLVGDGVVATVADVDPATVSVYMTNDLTRPILIDTNSDGICDELNDELDSLNNNITDTPTFVRRDLSGVTPAGQSYYPPTADIDGLSPTWDSPCVVGNAMTQPATLCGVTSPLSRVIKAPIPGALRPAIWALPMVEGNNCVGRSWDWRNDIPLGGPVCVVARAADTLGNVGVSRPLRVCLQRSSGTGFYDCSASAAWQNQNCMAGSYRGQTVSCTAPPGFTSGYVRAD